MTDNMKNNSIILYGIVGLLSAMAFVMIYGIRVLNPCYTDWLLNGADLAQHYLGWRGFREGGWQFPIGLTNMLAYPGKTSVIFTDSIPIFAVLFKLLSPLLPEEFQYFGLWGFLCFVLQGVLTARIIMHFTENKFAVICGSLITVFSPVLINRMFAHTALAGQWILILALEPLFVYKDKYEKNKKIYILVGIIALLSASTHMYFILMCGIVMCGICLEDILYKKRVTRSILILLIYIGIAGCTVAMLGGFSSQGSQYSADDGLGNYSMNWNSLMNPSGWSVFLQPMGSYTDGQYEGFGYLGLGSIMIAAFAGLLFIGSEGIKEIIDVQWKRMVSIVVVSVLMLVIAASPVGSFGAIQLYEWQLPDVIMNLWGVFRASGRMVMLVDYIIVITAIIVISKMSKPRMMSIVMAACLIIQVYDLQDILKDRHTKFNQLVEYKTVLNNQDFWNTIGMDEDISHVVITFWAGEQYYSFAEWALDYKMSMSSYFMAHPDIELLLQYAKQELDHPQTNEVFIFLDDGSIPEYDLHYYNVDGYVVGYMEKIPGFVEVK